MTHAKIKDGGYSFSGATGSFEAELLVETTSNIPVSNTSFVNPYTNGVEVTNKGSVGLTTDSFSFDTTTGNTTSGYPVRYDFLPTNLTS